MIKTKPIAHTRLESHTEQDVKDWFKKYLDILAEYKITKGKQVLNIDKSRARVRYPGGEDIIVLVDVKELYTASPENQKSVTVIETIITDRREPLPPFIIAPGQKIIDNWVLEKLIRTEHIAYTPTGYTNNDIVM